MLPLRDHNPTRGFPVATVLIILLNIFVFILELLQGENLEQFYYTAGLVPCALTGQCYVIRGALPPLVTLFTSMFMHAGWLHIGSNMLYLWIFGNNIEEAMGSIGYVVFYLICGLAASFSQIATDTSSTIVNLGASGAIAGVLGAYLILFPHAQVDTLVIFGYFYRLVALPAILVLGGWFVLQLFSGFLSLGVETGGGVAFFAHIGGFVAGLILVHLFRRRGYQGPQW